LITIQRDDYVFEALTIIIKRNRKRIGVTNNKGGMIGILGQIDILSHYANHTYVIVSKIKNANKDEDIKIASNDLLNISK
ncbi:CBS domain-containing protein, partial [Aliarcobacter butzleri]|uniref:CBS domain-containing protein n=1 Tax=Aliarcobacter butzleri TaxID=28197 RepID=UPI003B224EA0